MKRFYRYIIYKLYSYGLKKNNDTPIANVIITLAFVHFIQLFILYNILLIFFPLIDIYSKIDKIYVPKIGLADGLVQHLYNDVYSKM